jgi:hypothetical protein
VLLTLFVGQINISMAEAKQSLEAKASEAAKLASVVEETGVTPLHLDSYLALYNILDENQTQALTRGEVR